jgi:hypothetical protein
MTCRSSVETACQTHSQTHCPAQYSPRPRSEQRQDVLPGHRHAEQSDPALAVGDPEQLAVAGFQLLISWVRRGRLAEHRLNPGELGPLRLALFLQPVRVDQPRDGVLGVCEDGLQESVLVVHGLSRFSPLGPGLLHANARPRRRQPEQGGQALGSSRCSRPLVPREPVDGIASPAHPKCPRRAAVQQARLAARGNQLPLVVRGGPAGYDDTGVAGPWVGGDSVP